MTTDHELRQMLVGYMEDVILRLRRENSILRSELKERLISEFIGNYEMTDDLAQVSAEQYVVHLVAHNEGAE